MLSDVFSTVYLLRKLLLARSSHMNCGSPALFCTTAITLTHVRLFITLFIVIIYLPGQS